MSNFTLICIVVFFQFSTNTELFSKTNKQLGVNAHTQITTPSNFFSDGNYILEMPCESEHIILSNQSQVDNFIKEYPDCVVITSLEIIGKGIKNLNGLAGIQSVNKYLSIKSTGLEDLTGLGHMDLSALAYCIIQDNQDLLTLSGLNCGENLSHLSVRNNESLQEVDDLSSLESVGYFMLSKNAKLFSVEGLSKLKSADRFTLGENGLLQNLTGLENLERVITLSLHENHNLFNIDALSNLKEYQLCFIYNNCSLSDCCGIVPALLAKSKGSYLVVSSNSVGCRDNGAVVESCGVRNDLSEEKIEGSQ